MQPNGNACGTFSRNGRRPSRPATWILSIVCLLSVTCSGCKQLSGFVSKAAVYIPGDRAIAAIKEGEAAPFDGFGVTPPLMAEIGPALAEALKRKKDGENSGRDLIDEFPRTDLGKEAEPAFDDPAEFDTSNQQSELVPVEPTNLRLVRTRLKPHPDPIGRDQPVRAPVPVPTSGGIE